MENLKFKKPLKKDLPAIRLILKQWTDTDEVEKYVERIGNEIDGRTEHGMQFYVLRRNTVVVGIGGIADPLPKVSKFSKFNNPGAIKIIYLDNQYRGMGLGRALLENLEKEARKSGYDELLIRSAERYRNTAYGFYERMGYEIVGEVEGGEEGKKMTVFWKKL